MKTQEELEKSWAICVATIPIVTEHDLTYCSGLVLSVERLANGLTHFKTFLD